VVPDPSGAPRVLGGVEGAQLGAHPRQQLARAHRLGDHVVGAGVEPAHHLPLGLGGARPGAGQQDDGDLEGQRPRSRAQSSWPSPPGRPMSNSTAAWRAPDAASLASASAALAAWSASNSLCREKCSAREARSAGSSSTISMRREAAGKGSSV
jgi:hypothetical protein